jgi:hypothetical protein
LRIVGNVTDQSEAVWGYDLHIRRFDWIPQRLGAGQRGINRDYAGALLAEVDAGRAVSAVLTTSRIEQLPEELPTLRGTDRNMR